MNYNQIKFGCKIITLLFLITTVLNLSLVFLFEINTTNMLFYVLTVSFVSVFFILNIAAGIGIYFVKTWGFILGYIAIIFTTALFSIPYVPLIIHAFPQSIRFYAMIAINSLFLLSIVYLQIKLRAYPKVK